MGKPESGQQLLLSAREKARSTVLVIEPDQFERESMRNTLRNLGFAGFTDVPNHLAAFDKMQERQITHVVFDARPTNMPVDDFVVKALEFDPELVLIPTSAQPNVDDVFQLLILGARGYLCKPFTADSVELALGNASKGEPIADAVKQAKDRNEALVAIMMGNLDKVATILRQAMKFETAKREIPRALVSLRSSAELAKTFAKGGDDGLLEALEKFCLERSNGPATRLGRLRKKLRTTRVVEETEDPATPNSQR